jgi:hypothetical protein
LNTGTICKNKTGMENSVSFSGSMWFMPFFSTYGVSFGPLGLGYRATRVFDSGWMEYFGGLGLYLIPFNLGRVNQ